MTVKFRYGGLDRRAWWITILSVLLLGGVCAALWLTAGGAFYLAAWVTLMLTALVALCLLSVPRRIIVGEECVELRCLVETTYIPLGSIVDVEVVGRGVKGKFPLLGIYGFGGYYGRYYASRHIYKVYATRRERCVAIHTTKHRYMVSCGAPEMLRGMILDAKRRNTKED